MTTKITKEDGFIDLQKATPKEMMAKLRAYRPWPGLYVLHQGRRVKIVEAHVASGVVAIDRVQVEGKAPVAYRDFVNGYGSLL